MSVIGLSNTQELLFQGATATGDAEPNFVQPASQERALYNVSTPERGTRIAMALDDARLGRAAHLLEHIM